MKPTNLHDEHFKVQVISQSPIPQITCYAAMHTDYSEDNAWDAILNGPYQYNNPVNGRELTETYAGEIVVKRCLKKGHMGVCYSEDTKVLTDTGFKFWNEVTEQDKLAAYHFEEASKEVCKTITFEKPSELIKLKYDGDMYHASSRDYDQMVTMDHSLIVSHRTKKGSFSTLYRKKAKDIIRKPYRVVKSGYNSDMNEIHNPFEDIGLSLQNYLKLVGFYLSDGCKPHKHSANTIRFHLKRKRKIDFLKSIGLPIEEMKSDQFVIRYKGISKHFRDNFFDDEWNKVLPDSFILLGDRENFASLMEGFKNGDGTNWMSDPLMFCYDSTSIKLLEQIQALITLHGYSGSITSNGRAINNHNLCKRICITNKVVVRFEPSQKTRTPSAVEEIVPYSGYVYCANVSTGALVVQREGKVVVSGNCEHPQMVLHISGFSHEVMQQIRTHRHLSADATSGRYSGDRICEVAIGKRSIESVYYIRPEGTYTDRTGEPYEWTQKDIDEDLEDALKDAIRYKRRIDKGVAHEHARQRNTSYDIRQDFVLSGNARSMMHLCEMRATNDVQLEARRCIELIYPHLEAWMPEVFGWHRKNRLGKNKIAP